MQIVWIIMDYNGSMQIKKYEISFLGKWIKFINELYNILHIIKNDSLNSTLINTNSKAH